MKAKRLLREILCISLALFTGVSNGAASSSERAFLHGIDAHGIDAYMRFRIKNPGYWIQEKQLRPIVPVVGMVGFLGGLYSYFQQPKKPTIMSRYLMPAVSGICMLSAFSNFACATYQLAQQSDMKEYSRWQRYYTASRITAYHFMRVPALENYYENNKKKVLLSNSIKAQRSSLKGLCKELELLKNNLLLNGTACNAYAQQVLRKDALISDGRKILYRDMREYETGYGGNDRDNNYFDGVMPLTEYEVSLHSQLSEMAGSISPLPIVRSSSFSNVNSLEDIERKSAQSDAGSVQFRQGDYVWDGIRDCTIIDVTNDETGSESITIRREGFRRQRIVGAEDLVSLERDYLCGKIAYDKLHNCLGIVCGKLKGSNVYIVNNRYGVFKENLNDIHQCDIVPTFPNATSATVGVLRQEWERLTGEQEQLEAAIPEVCSDREKCTKITKKLKAIKARLYELRPLFAS